MNRPECGKLIKLASATWGHSPFSLDTAALWWDELNDLPYEVLEATVRVMGRDEGREHAPSAGAVRRRAVELTLDPRPWGTAQRWLKAYVGTGYHAPGDPMPGRREEALRVKAKMPPLVAGFIDAVGGGVIYETWSDGGNGEARLRTKYEAYVKDAVDSAVFAGLDVPGLARIERANQTATPVPIGHAIRAALEAGAA